MPRLLFVTSDNSASTYYRLVMIAAALKRAGYHADYGAAQTLHDSIVHRYDVIVGSRLAQNLDVIQQSFDAVKRLGKVIFVDYDDALLSIPEHNPAYLKDTSTVEEWRAWRMGWSLRMMYSQPVSGHTTGTFA